MNPEGWVASEDFYLALCEADGNTAIHPSYLLDIIGNSDKERFQILWRRETYAMPNDEFLRVERAC